MRPAKRNLPAYDSDNDIGFVARARFALAENRTGDLTMDEQVQLQRCTFVDDQIRAGRGYNQRALRNLVIAKYGVSWDTANRDIQNTRQLFHTTFSDKEYLRDILTEKALTAGQKAENVGDFKAAKGLWELAAVINHLKEPPKQKQDNDKLKAFRIIVKFDPQALGFKPVKNKEQILEKYRSRRDVMRKVVEEAEDAQLDE